MAVTIVDRRTTLDDAEATTNYTPGSYGTVSTDVAEATNAVAESIAIGDQSLYYTMPTGNIDVSDTLVYVYSFNNALQNSWDNTIPPNALLLGDGTNRIGFHMAGGDKRVFNHLDGPTNWQCFVLDGDQADEMDTAGHSYADAGSFGSLDLTQVVDVGCYHETLSKALAGGYNVAVDIIRYGNDGIYVQGGTSSGAAGTCSQLAAADRSTADGAGHGIFRELQPVAFGCQGPLTFADPTDTTNDQYFEDSGVTIVFEDRNISDGKYYFDVRGNSSQTQSFILTNSSIVAAGPSVKLATSADIDVMIFDRVQFIDWGGVIIFPTDSASYTHEVTNCGFNNCGKITIGTVDFDDNSIIDSASTANAVDIGYAVSALNMVISGYEGTASTGALLYNVNEDPNGNIDGGSFTKGTAATHAIDFGTSTPTTMTLTGIDFSGYNASNEQNDSTLRFRHTSGTVTVNLIGCTGNISYKKEAGATVVLVVNPVSFTVTVTDTNTKAAIQYAKVTVWATATGNLPYQDSVVLVRSGSTVTVTHSAHGLATDQWVEIEGAVPADYNGIWQITWISDSSYSYEILTTPVADTGTPLSTAIIVNGETNASGIITDSRSYTADQGYDGKALKGTHAPVYKEAPVSGTLDKDVGVSLNVPMIPD